MLVDSDAALDKIFKHCNKVIAIHSEDEAILQKMAKSGIGKTFTDHPKVINGASDLMFDVFGEIGRHARFAVGVSSLPLGVAVEVDGIFEIN